MSFCDVTHVVLAIFVLGLGIYGVVVFFRSSTEGKLSEKITALCAVLALLVAVVTVGVAWGQLQESKQSAARQLQESKESAERQLSESKAQSAKDIYKEYISLAMQNPKISAQSCYGGEAGLKKIKSSSVAYEEYENFVAFMLFSAEQILALTNADEQWAAVIKAQLVYHAVYLRSAHFQVGMRNFYSWNLQYLIDVAIDEYSRNKCGRDNL